MAKHEETRVCDVCMGCGYTPIECFGADFETGVRFYRAKPGATECSKCGGKGERLVVVSDEPEKRDEAMDDRERMQANADFLRSQERYR